ncbi:MAG: hypothetical protein MUE54_13935 [Anaerolineae bacterium]|jgi:hypothetical protein|nr:hypothetical protein [Anaerolineae bacterium]
MPAVDTCQPQVIRALEKEGWRILLGETRFRKYKRSIMIDIRAVHGANGSSKQILLAEVKCFGNSSEYTRDLYTAIGQYIVYRAMLNELNDATPLYLAIPVVAYDELFDAIIQRAVNDAKIKLIVVDIVQEVIVTWKE